MAKIRVNLNLKIKMYLQKISFHVKRLDKEIQTVVLYLAVIN